MGMGFDDGHLRKETTGIMKNSKPAADNKTIL